MGVAHLLVLRFLRPVVIAQRKSPLEDQGLQIGAQPKDGDPSVLMSLRRERVVRRRGWAKVTGELLMHCNGAYSKNTRFF